MKIAILGTGRMGAWLASTMAPGHELALFDPNQAASERAAASAAAATGTGGAAKALGRLEELAGFGPDMLVNCSPLGLTTEAFDAALPYLPVDCLLCDIASVKTDLGEWYRAAERPFASSHPMFGPTYADASNLHEQSAVVIAESCPAGKAFWKSFYEGLGIAVFEESFDEHDRTVAYSLATPFASTMVFAACMRRLDAPGTNFKKHLAIARGLLAEDDRLLAEIMFNPHVTRRLELINSQLTYLSHIIKDRDHEEMGKFLARLRDNIGA